MLTTLYQFNILQHRMW